MPRIPVALVALLALSGVVHGDPSPAPANAALSVLFTPINADNRLIRSLAASGAAHSTPAALACCKVCSIGKACGNTCISRDKTCHVGQGCACDG
jgi:hypothetical protein